MYPTIVGFISNLAIRDLAGAGTLNTGQKARRYWLKWLRKIQPAFSILDSFLDVQPDKY